MSAEPVPVPEARQPDANGAPAPGNAEEQPAADAPRPQQDTDRSADAEPAEGEHPTEAWAAARELRDYAPPSFGGGLVAGNQHGVSGGRVHGHVVMGNAYFGAPVAERLQGSGEVLGGDVDRLADVFHESPAFVAALEELRASRVVILRGEHDSGRGTAALMLLRHVGAARIRAVDPEDGPAVLVKEAEAADGYVVADLPTSRSRPLGEHHLLRCRERLRKRDAYLVVTVENSAVLRDVRPVAWRPPAADAVLRSHLRAYLDTGDAAEVEGVVDALLDVAQVRAFLAVEARPVAQIAGFAAEVARYHRGEIDAERLDQFGQESLLGQVREWLGAPEDSVTLRDKAFLLALAVCDEGPYATAAEFGDRLCHRMQRVESPEEDPGLTIFSTSPAERMKLARARCYKENEQTPWGPLPQSLARFEDPRTAELLLREAWAGHPAVRAPMSGWLTDLARHADPFVRTRAAATAATLAVHDFSSTMHGLLLDWASSRDYRLCVQAANALALAADAGTPAVHRVLRDWSTDSHPRRRWTALRAYGLVGPLAPAQTLDSLADLVTRPVPGAGEPDGPSAAELAAVVDAAELLLLDTPGSIVLRRLTDWCDADPPALRAVAHQTLLAAAARREVPFDDPASWPLLLRLYDDAEPGSPVTDAFTALWRRVLGDRRITAAAQQRLREWVLTSEDEAGVETVLAGLLPQLVASDSDRDRLCHLLRVMPGRDGGPPPPVAHRLLGGLTARSET
ncbi:hypothetical protein [Streptomyces litchfieldiae]|uniref:LigA protein n=1 Tax=Streptomyces litchfieldiae TaxID=3075543 RepID=A0ABU2MKV6_9ACTN|nr:hypothetical protein [Streptomyces sp. DSM 44938]MDT0342013.1 hypothetical protein [Streptomyces sp. DSM 44938]